ncbi:MAG: hypothetical protein DRZ90_12740 [Spirochaetes bacterium]|nr:MAG: hypothetical protein DRZ90_12740 [Spirochaetota bacterium]
MRTSWATDPDRGYGGIRKGSAQAVMGNHEINAVAWHSSDPLNPGDFLRYHKLKKNMNQHRAFLKQVGGDVNLHRELADWFLTLPLCLDYSVALGGSLTAYRRDGESILDSGKLVWV